MSLQGHTFSSLESHSNQEWFLITGERLLPSKKKGRKGNLGKDQLVRLNPVPGKITKQVLRVCVHIMKDGAVTRNSQNGFSRDKVCLTSLPALLME